jgi:hypothetical protein
LLLLEASILLLTTPGAIPSSGDDIGVARLQDNAIVAEDIIKRSN